MNQKDSRKDRIKKLQQNEDELKKIEKEQQLAYLNQRRDLDRIKQEKEKKRLEEIERRSTPKIDTKNDKESDKQEAESEDYGRYDIGYSKFGGKLKYIIILPVVVAIIAILFLYLTDFYHIREIINKNITFLERYFPSTKLNESSAQPSRQRFINDFDKASVQDDDVRLQAFKTGDRSKIDELIKSGADLNIHDKTGKTPLIFSSTKDDPDVVRKLLDAGADINQSDRWNNSPLMYASKYGSDKVATLLIDRGANLNLMSNDGETAVSILSDSGKSDNILSKVIDKGASLEVLDKDGNTALMKAAIRGNLQSSTLLIRRHVDINGRNNNGKTALMFAAENGQFGVVRLLLESGARTDIFDNYGNDALSYAKRLNHGDIERLMNGYIEEARR